MKLFKTELILCEMEGSTEWQAKKNIKFVKDEIKLLATQNPKNKIMNEKKTFKDPYLNDFKYDYYL